MVIWSMQKNRRFITLLIMLLVLSPAVLASCDSGTSEYAEAEAEVAAELDAVKSGSTRIPALTGSEEDIPEEMSEAMLSAYVEKLRDFDYMITGSAKSEDGEAIIVTVDITTYDFGKVYLETWNDRMKIEKDLRYDSQFYGDLFTRFAAMSVKEYSGHADITCTRDESGPELMDIISGGMVSVMAELAGQ